jgi:YidC/Oxa1 family membrane protein insertase
MEKRALIAIVFSLMILIAYQEWITRYYEPPVSSPVESENKQVQGQAPREGGSKAASLKSAPARPERIFHKAETRPAREVTVETENYVARFANHGARLRSFSLKRYRAGVGEKSPPIELISAAQGVVLPLGVGLGDSATDGDMVFAVEGGDMKLAGNETGRLKFTAAGSGGAILTKEFIFNGSSYEIGLKVSYENGNPATPHSLLLSADGLHRGAKGDAAFEGFLAVVDGKVKREPASKIGEKKDFKGELSWAGFGYTYFLFAALPESPPAATVSVSPSGSGLQIRIGQGTTAESAYRLFIGPKELETLKAMGRGVERSIDFGYFAFVATPILYLLHLSHRFTQSYGIDIVLLTVLIKLLTAPLTHKSFTSMKQMQKLQPQMERIKEKFKDDRERMNKEIMELYRRNQVNPFGGCLPMLIQLPIFIGLYNALLTPIELRHAPFLWVKDLSRPDWESLPVALAGWEIGIPVLTLLMGASMFVQQWMTPSAGDPNQKRLMLLMPAIFTLMFVNFPSGLTIYWLVNNVLTIAQQYLAHRMER